MRTSSSLRAPLGLLVLAFALGSCSDPTGNDDRCGKHQIVQKEVGEPGWDVYEDGEGMSFATKSIVAPSVCVAVHSQLKWSLVVRQEIEVTVQAAVMYGFRYKEIPLEKEWLSIWFNYIGEHSLGVKDQYAEDPGEFEMFLVIGFPSQGDYSADIQFLESTILPTGYFRAEYYLPKS